MKIIQKKKKNQKKLFLKKEIHIKTKNTPKKRKTKEAEKQLPKETNIKMKSSSTKNTSEFKNG
jgi:hypothetical protein